jgi:DUF438 domain-containing protein
MMVEQLLMDFLDSMKHPLVFVDTGHTIRYMNRPARDRYRARPAEVGRSIFDCHNDESNRVILAVFERLREGADEEIITDNEEHRVYMRAVRDRSGALIGYYERFEAPRKSGG